MDRDSISRPAPVDVWPEVFATHKAAGHPFQLQAPLHWNRPLTGYPLMDGLPADAEGAGESCSAAKGGGDVTNSCRAFHGLEGKAFLDVGQSLRAVRLLDDSTAQMENNKIASSADLARWLSAAIARSGMSGAQIARQLGVTRQAVVEWKRTGRISKWHLDDLCRMLGERPPLGGAFDEAAEEIELLASFRRINNPERRAAILDFVRAQHRTVVPSSRDAVRHVKRAKK